MGVGSRVFVRAWMFMYACVCVCECRVNCRLGGATHCLPCLWSRGGPLVERWSWWHVVPVTGRLASDSSLLLELWEPAGLPLDRQRHRDCVYFGRWFGAGHPVYSPTNLYTPPHASSHKHLITNTHATGTLWHGVSSDCWSHTDSIRRSIHQKYMQIFSYWSLFTQIVVGGFCVHVLSADILVSRTFLPLIQSTNLAE